MNIGKAGHLVYHLMCNMESLLHIFDTYIYYADCNNHGQIFLNYFPLASISLEFLLTQKFSFQW